MSSLWRPLYIVAMNRLDGIWRRSICMPSIRRASRLRRQPRPSTLGGLIGSQVRQTRGCRGASPTAVFNGCIVATAARICRGSSAASSHVKRGSHMTSSGSILGNSVLRLEDPTLLTGEAKYLDDMVEPGMLHISFVRSEVAHGLLNSVDISEAENMPGVRAI